MTSLTATTPPPDPLEIEAIDYLEIFAENGREAAYALSQLLGLTPVAYRGPETGWKESASYVLVKDQITLVVTAPLRSTHAAAKFIFRHGTSVREIAFRTTSCATFHDTAVARGAESVEAPHELTDDRGTVRRAAIRTYGDVVHSIIERKGYAGLFLPGFHPFDKFFTPFPSGSDTGLSFVDHIVGNVELGQMERWVSFYARVLGFSEMRHFSDNDISTEYSALMSKVMRDGNFKVKLPINEPAQGKRKSQIDEYLEFHDGPGVQHIALLTQDIIATVTELRRRGVQFLRVPKTYYEDLQARVGVIKEDVAAIAELGILVDRDEDGYLLQIFTKPFHDRPTLFFEIIQRAGSLGFGVGNFKALFEAIEREQELRGNL
jgi:4-hydroxyphenylpyruvate dioxygenase